MGKGKLDNNDEIERLRLCAALREIADGTHSNATRRLTVEQIHQLARQALGD